MLLAGVASVLLLHSAPPAEAQTLNERLARQGQAAQRQQGRLLVEAREIIYDNDRDRVEARGDVQLYYQGRSLEADRVVYDRASKRVFAEGNARLKEPNGQVVYSDRFELTEDFRDGFIDSIRLTTPDNQRFTARRAERTDGETTVFEQGTYTACEPCKQNPEKPPLWQVKAARIISKNQEQVIYYEDATLEFWGVPVAWLPFFSAPDPTVTRKSGVLTPRFVNKTALGQGVSLPIYWAVAPNYDLLYTPTALTRQGLLNQLEFRHRLQDGAYTLRGAGIFQRERNAFLPAPFGAGDKTFRGSFETTGKFFINEKWNTGWDVAFSTDKYFFNNYNIRSESLGTNYFRESTSTVYLNGQGSRSWFDLRGYYFRGLSQYDWQKQLPVVHPVFDYDRRFTSDTLGGEFGLTVNFTSISRDAAQFFDLPDGTPNWFPTRLASFPLDGSTRAIYEGCAIYERSRCILRGIGGSYSRLSTVASWRRQMIDPLGQVWTPFANVQMDATWLDLNTTRHRTNPSNLAVFGNEKQLGYFSGSDDFSGRIMPTVGVEYRYPFVASSDWATHVVEPIAQVVASPSERRSRTRPNEDAQSLVFDDTSIFQWNRFSGFDRTEGGVRANVAAQYSATFNQGGYANLLFGQSYHLAGRNSFAAADVANTGRDSGLETRRSDYVGRVQIRPNDVFSFAARGRFDERTLKMNRLEVEGSVNSAFGTLSATYGNYAAQPELGWDRRREGLLTYGRVNVTPNWHVSGSVLFDLDRYLTDRAIANANPAQPQPYKNTPFRVASFGVGFGYQDECTVLSFNYSRSTNDSIGARDQTTQLFMLRLELKHLGQINYSQNTGSSQDGLGLR
jgi:LPS-assembly protein